MASLAPIPTITLNTGRKIPALALGTWESPPDVVASAVFTAIKAGYRHIDTAAIYGNEEGVGAGIKQAIEELGVKREELYITTKLWLADFHNVPEALETSLGKLFPGDKNAYVDLYLMHWPFGITKDKKLDTTITFQEAWASMEKLPESKTRDLGISNFTIARVKELLKTAKKTPVVNQVELHTTLPQFKLVDFLLSGKYDSPAHDGKIIHPEAYSPLARGNLTDPAITKLAEKYGVSSANIVLSWGIRRGTIVLPKSVTPSRIVDNLKYVQLSDADFEAINELAKHSKLERYCSMPQIEVFDDNADSK